MYGQQKEEFTSDHNLLVVSEVALGTFSPSSISSSLTRTSQKKKTKIVNVIKTVLYEVSNVPLPHFRNSSCSDLICPAKCTCTFDL